MTDALLAALEKNRPTIHSTGPLDDTRAVSIAEIQTATARHFSITIQSLIADGRSNVIPRSIAIYLSRQFTYKSFEVIGDLFRRDHSTVIYAFKKIARLQGENHQVASDIEQIKTAIFGQCKA